LGFAYDSYGTERDTLKSRAAAATPNPLPRRPAVGDNAAMEAESLKAEPPKRKRRWFQFSLRTLLIAVTVVALLAGQQLNLGS
jgi:hypothetical protein